MDNDPIEREAIENLLRRFPERDVPAGLHERIVANLPLANRSRRPPSRLRTCWERLMLLAPMPMKAGAIAALTAAAFWLGTEVGSRQATDNVALLLEPDAMPTTTGNAEDGYRSGMGWLEEGADSYAFDFSSAATLPERRSNTMQSWPDIFLGAATAPITERQQPRTTAAPGVDSVLFLLNLAHNLAASGNYQGALYQYEKVLRLNPMEQTALYNRAICYQHLDDRNGAQQALTDYLAHYRVGRWAIQAVGELQRLEVFDYQTAIIGGRKIVVNQAVLLGGQQPARRQELERLAPYLRRPFIGELHLVVFYRDDLERSRTIAAELKQQINAMLGEDRALPIRTSWFDVAAPIRTGAGEKGELENGLFLFTQPSTQQGSTT